MTSLVRRAFVGAGLAGLAAMMVRPGLSKSQSALADSDFIALSDGSLSVPSDFFPGASDSEKAHLGSQVSFGANVYLWRHGDRTFLIDAGAGNGGFVKARFDNVGRLPEQLAGRGIQPSDITDIVVTHMHIDHFGGLIRDGQPIFSNARIHVEQIEWDFWTRDGFAKLAPEALRPMVTSIQQTALKVRDQMHFHRGDQDLGGGIHALKSHGHTPGHDSVMLDTGPHQVLVLGDVVVSDRIHFANPAVGWGLDIDSDAARATRRRLLDMAATDDLIIAANHVSSPGLGRVRRSGNGYAFEPL